MTLYPCSCYACRAGYQPKAIRMEMMEWEDITKIEGPHGRHIEQLWDEIHKLRERVCELEKWVQRHSEYGRAPY